MRVRTKSDLPTWARSVDLPASDGSKTRDQLDALPPVGIQTITTLHAYCRDYGYTEEASKLEAYGQAKTGAELERTHYRAEHGDAALAARDWTERQREREAFFAVPRI